MVGSARQPGLPRAIPVRLEAPVAKVASLGRLEVGEADVGASQQRPVDVALMIGDVDPDYAVPPARPLDTRIGQDSEACAAGERGEATQQRPTLVDGLQHGGRLLISGAVSLAMTYHEVAPAGRDCIGR